ncbi:protein Spindly isoform X2 [Hyperolius riggenbachi]|uniref:protein Spindly isoform X2 n=1 Tax=Hyperolius riggenbachi TaxID=752182 RepID=UPI0035A28670
MDQSDTIMKLRHRLKEAEEERNKAAQYGLQLMESQSDLQNQLEEQRNEMTNTIEILEQEKYSLSREVELKSRMLDSLTLESENVKQQHKVCLEQLQEKMQRAHNCEVFELKEKLEKLKVELEEARLNEKQLKHKLEHQAEVLANKNAELRMMSERAHETMSSEMLSLQLEIEELESSKAFLQEEMNELLYRQQQLVLANSNLNQQVEHLQNEKEERQKEAVVYFNALEKARGAYQELQIQLDQALQQAQDPNSKGNSLFAEVEDRRAEMERQLIGMKVQYQSVQKQHAFSRQQMHRMKVQIATLLQLKGSQTDPEQLERLQSMISQKNSEIEKLLMKVRQLEKYQLNSENGPAHMNTNAVIQGDEAYYVDLLKMKIENSSKEIEKMKDELSLQRMKALAESQRVLELERKLFTNERHLTVSKSENMKLRVCLDELKMKYEPDETIKLRTQKRRREQLPIDGFSEDTAGLNDQLVDTTESAVSKDQEEKVNDFYSKQNEPCSIPETYGAEQGVCFVLPSTDSVLQPVKERKRVRIADDLKSTEGLNENDCTLTTSARSAGEGSSPEIKNSEQKDLRKCEKKSSQRVHPVLHVSSKPGTVAQCPQQ